MSKNCTLQQCIDLKYDMFQKGTERLLKQTISFLKCFNPVVYLFRFLWDKIFYRCHLNLNVSDLLVCITGTDILDEEIVVFSC